MFPDNVVAGIKTYSGRDACIRVVAYFALFLYGVIDLAVKHFSADDYDQDETPFYFYAFTFFSVESLVKASQSCRLIAKQFSVTRLITRFFDDIPALQSLYNFWIVNFPEEAAGVLIAPLKFSKFLLNWMTVINLTFWVLYNPFEHIAYLGELKVIEVNHGDFYDYTNVCWAGALGTSVLLNLRIVFVYFLQQMNKANLENDPQFDKSELLSLADMKRSVFIAFRDFLDFCMAINYMPQGWIPWTSRLYHYQIGLLGTTSSVMRLQQYLFY